MFVSILLLCLSCLALASGYVIPPQNFKRSVPGEPLPSSTAAASAAPKLKPINIHIYDSAVSGNPLRKRDVLDLKNLEPQDKARLVYGALNEDGNVLLADMTLYAPSEKLIVSMETFEGLTKEVDCNGKDGRLSITFQDKQAFEYAIGKWSYINEDADTQFILITNHDGCGPDEERQAYMVNEVDNDEQKFITYLKVTEAKWEDIAGTFDLDFGRAAISNVNSGQAKARLRRRSPGFWDDVNPKNWVPKVVEAGKDVVEAGVDLVEDTVDTIKDGAGKVADTVEDVFEGAGKGFSGLFDKIEDNIDDVIDEFEDATKKAGKWAEGAVDDFVDGIEDLVDAITDISASESVVFPMYLGTPNSPINIYKNDIVKVDCSNCFIGGSFKLTGTVRLKFFVVTELSVELRPQDFKAALEVTSSLNVKYGKGHSKDINLFELPIPNAGIVVPGIFSIGAIAGIDVGYELSATADVSFTIGLNAQIPNAAYVRADLANLGKSGAGGWGGVSVTPVVKFDINNATVHGAVHMRPKIAVKIELLKLGKAEVACKMDLPKISADAAIKQDKTGKTGVCPNSKKEFGISVDMSATLGLNLVAEASITGLLDEKWEKSLFSIDIYKKNICLPFDNPFDQFGNKKPSKPLELDPPPSIIKTIPPSVIKQKLPSFLATKLANIGDNGKFTVPTNVIKPPAGGFVQGLPTNIFAGVKPTATALIKPPVPFTTGTLPQVSSSPKPPSTNSSSTTTNSGAKWIPINLKVKPADAAAKAKDAFAKANSAAEGALPGKVTTDSKKEVYHAAAPVAELPNNLEIKGAFKGKYKKKPQYPALTGSAGASRLLVKMLSLNGTVVENNDTMPITTATATPQRVRVRV